MKKKIVIFGGIGVVVLVGVLLFYFLYLGHPSRQTLATVNGEKITREQFDQELIKIENPMRDMYKEEPGQFLEGMIMKLLMLQEAKKQGITPPVKTFKDAAKDAGSPDEILIAELMKKKFSTPPPVTKEEIQTFYAMFKGQMEGKKLEQVAPAIEQMIREGKQQQAMEEYLKEVRNAGKVDIDGDRLKKIALKAPESNTEEEFKKALTSGKPVLVDFGANSCVPCRQLRPILKEISQENAGKATILVIDVYKYQGLAKDYKVALLPTLVFFDSNGKEVFRQMGIMDKEKIVAKLKEIGMVS